ncbi:MAG: ABC transporter substrate-binding protein [Anaerolineae bacterium]|nr:ABC transporter substrate-binding protein [Anaerolineae bacterium]
MSEKATIRIGHLKITDHLVLGVTQDKIQKGIETPKYLDLQTQAFVGWNPLGVALREGKVDAACILAPLAMEIYHMDKKSRLVLFTHKSGSVIIKNKRANINTIEDFKGKTVLIPHFLSIHNLLFERLLSEKGLTVGVGPGKDVSFEVVAPSEIPEIMEYDEKGHVGGFIVAEPYGSQVVMAGFGEEFALSKDIWPNHPCCLLVVREEVLQKSPDAVQELVNSMVDSGNFVDANPDSAAEIGAKFLGQEKAVINRVLTQTKGRLSTNELMPNLDDLDTIQGIMTQRIKAMSDKIDLDKFADLSFAKNAGAK